MSFITIYVTHENMEEAERLVSLLLKEKAIACANFFPIKSMYTWNGGIKTEEEIVTLLKTRKENWDELVYLIEENHKYEIPCIMRFDIEDANRKYNSWVNGSVEIMPIKLRKLDLDALGM